jgi:hypothetical protein
MNDNFTIARLTASRDVAVVPSGLEKAESEEARAEGRAMGGRRAAEYAFRKYA